MSGSAAMEGSALARMAYSDVRGLQRLKSDGPAALEQAAAQFESMFVDMWLSGMRDAGKVFSEGSYLSSASVDMHQEMLDHQWAVHVAESGGLGLRDVILRQLGGGANGDPAGSATDDAAGHAAMASTVPPRHTFARPPEPAVAGPAAASGVGAAHPAHSAADVAATAPETSDTGGFAAALFDGAEKFVRTLEPLVRRIAGQSGIHPVAVLAQAALETGWGAKVIHDAAGQPSYNLFGIKAHGWEGPAVEVTTLEHQFDRFVRKVDSFRAYAGIAEAVTDYVDFLRSNGRYAGALEVADDPAAYADALQAAGYATDPGYASKLKALQRRIQGMLETR